MNDTHRDSVKFKVENEKKASVSSAAQTSGASSKPLTHPLLKKESSIDKSSTDDARRFRSETVRKNWKLVLDVAMNKRNEALLDQGVTLNMSSFSQPQNQEIYASEKENWIYFSIIISTVVILSILFCYLVYSFFPSFRAQNF